MHRTPPMTPAQARDTIDRLSQETISMRRHDVAPEPMIAEFNTSLASFVPLEKMPHFFIGKNRYVGDTARPGAFVAGGLFRRLIEDARIDFDTLLAEQRQQTPGR